MELHEIRYFLAVARTRNFTRAAAMCHITQPALTRAVRKLEAEFGAPLLVREPANLHLTELGRVLEPSLHAMLEHGDHARRTADRYLRLTSASLRLGIMCTVGPARFTAFLDRFRSAYPGIAMTLVEGEAAHLAELLRQGEIDVAVLADPDGFAAPLRASPLYRERLVLACARTHRFARREAVALRDLDGERYLERTACEYQDHIARHLAAAGARVVCAHRSERDDWIQSMVAAGMGVCFLPEHSATLPGVRLVPVVEPGIVREICAVGAIGRPASAPVRALLAAFTRHPWASETDPPGARARPDDRPPGQA